VATRECPAKAVTIYSTYKRLDELLLCVYNTSSIQEDAEQALSGRAGGALEKTMSLTPVGGPGFPSHDQLNLDKPRAKITTASLREKKLRREPITCLTAYDYSTARLVDEAGIEMILVGDSLAQVMLGYENTLSVTMDEMLHHVKAVRRAVKHALLLADMPYGSYQVDPHDALRNATRFVKEGGAEVVKIEGGEKRADLIRRIIDAEIPVAGHIGLTPQSVNVMGGYKVQGKNLSGIEQLMRDAVALDRAGVACLVLEGIPREVAAMITAEVGTPTIGIGAGPECDGQVLVFHDLLNLTFAPPAKFMRRYGDAAALITRAVQAFRADVKSLQYPSDEESYHLPKETKAGLDTVLARKRAMRQ
jgi:3-methyl-2-oxobutanoate hydroxymethyltransferase